jgi:20S proteasome alpha/beta subunit
MSSKTVSSHARSTGKKPELFVSDITGNYFSYYANVIGENDDKIREELREKYIAINILEKNLFCIVIYVMKQFARNACLITPMSIILLVLKKAPD